MEESYIQLQPDGTELRKYRENPSLRGKREKVEWKYFKNSAIIAYLRATFEQVAPASGKNKPPKTFPVDPEELPAFEKLFFNSQNAERVKQLMPPNRQRVTMLCLAMAEAIITADFSKPGFDADTMARVIAWKVYRKKLPKRLGNKARGVTENDVKPPQNEYTIMRRKFYSALTKGE